MSEDSYRRTSMQLEVHEQSRNAEGYYQQPLREGVMVDHQPWPQTKKQHGPRKSRRQSVLAEELEALGLTSEKTLAAGSKRTANEHWSLLAMELKQTRLKEEADQKAPAEGPATAGQGRRQSQSEKSSLEPSPDRVNGMLCNHLITLSSCYVSVQ